MKAWSNIEVPGNDIEIIAIDKCEHALGKIPRNALKVRELITGFEVCHFKFREHLQHIRNSIILLKPYTDLRKIGSSHLRHGENAWKSDKTGRSLTGRQYVSALNDWLGDKALTWTDETPADKDSLAYATTLNRKVKTWLGPANPYKTSLVSLLRARLLWDWDAYEKLKKSDDDELENQVCRIDICHYKFPKNLNSLLQAIGRNAPVKDFEGCGSCNRDIKKIVTHEYDDLTAMIDQLSREKPAAKTTPVKKWLIFCLLKTLKAQTGLNRPVYTLTPVN